MSDAVAVRQSFAPARKVAARSTQAQKRNQELRMVLLCVAHTPLALLVYRVSSIALLHALITLLVGLFLALSGRRRLIQVAYWGAYVAGVEVIWRMAGAPIFWEYGKYVTVFVLLLAMARSNLFKFRFLPLAYFTLLLPSVVLTVLNADPEIARTNISGNLSGPFALMVYGLFFSQVKLTIEEVKKIFLAVIIPTIGIAIITIYSTAATAQLVFSDNSNKATSGGFGPNQVSSTLGLGALAAWLFISLTSSKLRFKIFLFAVMGLLTIQSAMTFSRGGLYNAAGGAILGSLFLMKDGNSRLKVALGIVTTILVANFIVLPYLQSFTGGTLGTRFANTNTSGRTDIILADLEIWRDNPILGIGPGMAKGVRARYYERAGSNGAHTEFTRLVSEHGVLGFIAFLLFIYAGLKNLRQARTAKAKALIVSMMVWSLLYMTNAAMRLVAPSFAFGLTFAAFFLENNFGTLKNRRNKAGAMLKGKRFIPSRVGHPNQLTRMPIVVAARANRKAGRDTSTES